MKRDFLTLKDYTDKEIMSLVKEAYNLKAQKQEGKQQDLLKGKSLVMIFDKPSTRTRVSFDIAMNQLGGHTVTLLENECGMGKRESVGDIAKTLSRYADGIMIRTFKQSVADELAKYHPERFGRWWEENKQYVKNKQNSNMKTKYAKGGNTMHNYIYGHPSYSYGGDIALEGGKSALSGALSGAAIGAAGGPIGILGGALIGLGTGIFGGTQKAKAKQEQQNMFEQQQEAQRIAQIQQQDYLNKIQQPEFNTYTNPYMRAYGGYVGPEYEAEGGEVVEYQQGGEPYMYNTGKFNRNSSTAGVIDGRLHSEGGESMSGGERVFSDQMYVDDEFLKTLNI